MNFRVGGADVHVVPAPAGHPMLNILVTDLYGGRGASKVDIDDDIRVTADLDRVSLDGVSRALAGYPALSGLMKKGSVDLTFAPGDALRMFGSLRGSIRASVEKGKLLASKGGKPLRFDSLSLNSQAAAAPAKNLKKLPSVMDFRGAWNVGITAADWSVSAEAKQAALRRQPGSGSSDRIGPQYEPRSFHHAEIQTRCRISCGSTQTCAADGRQSERSNQK